MSMSIVDDGEEYMVGCVEYEFPKLPCDSLRVAMVRLHVYMPAQLLSSDKIVGTSIGAMNIVAEFVYIFRLIAREKTRLISAVPF